MLCDRRVSKENCEQKTLGLKNDFTIQITSIDEDAGGDSPGESRRLTDHLFRGGTAGIEIIIKSISSGFAAQGELLAVEFRSCDEEELLKEVAKYKMIESPEELEYTEWDALTAKFRDVALNRLQDLDQQLTIQHRMNTGDVELTEHAIEERLRFENPRLWRSLGMMWTHEKRVVYERLQERRVFWDEGKTPPNLPDPICKEEEALQLSAPVFCGTCQKEITSVENHKDKAQTNYSSKAATPNPGQGNFQDESDSENEDGGLEKPIQISSSKPNISTPTPQASSSSTMSTKEHHVNTPIGKSNGSPIIIDDSEDEEPTTRVTKRKAATLNITTPTTIKSEPSLAGKRSISHQSIGTVHKRVKVEPEAGSVPNVTDRHLRELTETEESLEEELRAAQRVADLMREKKENRRLIAALKAGSSPTP